MQVKEQNKIHFSQPLLLKQLMPWSDFFFLLLLL